MRLKIISKCESSLCIKKQILTSCFIVLFYAPCLWAQSVLSLENDIKKIMSIMGDQPNSPNGGTLNFNSFFEGIINDIVPGGDGVAATVIFNVPTELKGNLRFKAVIHEPTIFESLKQKYPADIQVSATALLKDQLQQLDHVDYELTWGLETDKLGRSLLIDGTNLKTFFSSQAMTLFGTKDLSGKSSSQGTAAAGSAAVIKPEEVFRQVAPYLKFIAQNQSQFNTSLKYTKKDELVGRDDFSIKFSYEKGFNGIKWAEKKKVNLFSGSEREKAKRQYRLTYSFEYTSLDDYDSRVLKNLPAGLPELSESLVLDSDHAIKGSFVAGFNPRIVEGKATARTELRVDYEKYYDSVRMPDRLTVHFMFTQRRGDNTTFPITLKWANHAEYLGEVDQELSAHFGVLYKIPKKMN